MVDLITLSRLMYFSVPIHSHICSCVLYIVEKHFYLPFPYILNLFHYTCLYYQEKAVWQRSAVRHQSFNQRSAAAEAGGVFFLCIQIIYSPIIGGLLVNKFS